MRRGQICWRVLVYEFLSAGGLVEGDDDGALLAQGVAMRHALAADLLRADCDVTVATFDGAPAPPRGAAHDDTPPRGAAHDDALPREATAVAMQRGESELEFVARLARRHDAVWVVAPETAGLLAAFERCVAASTARWIGCDAATIAIASSKAATVERLHARGIATPLAAALCDAPRWVVKPDDGAGAVATRVHPSRAAALADQRQRNRSPAAAPSVYAAAWAEPWVDGEAMSLTLHCDAAGAELLSVNRQHIAVDEGGHVSYRGVTIDVLPRHAARWQAFAALADDVAAALPGLRGIVGIDGVWHDALGPVAIEVNPRLTCAYVGLSQRLGRNLAAEVLAQAQRHHG